MNRDEFYFLYVNCNSIAEVAMRQAAADLLRELESQPPPEPVTLSPDELAAKLRADFENVDLSVLKFDFSDSAPPLAESPDTTPNADMAQQWPVDSMEPEAEELDLELYMSRAYAHEEALRPRVDDYFSKADVNALQSSLEKLPAGLPSLTGRLSADEVSRWLALYEQNDESLSNLVVTIRQLDMGA